MVLFVFKTHSVGCSASGGVEEAGSGRGAQGRRGFEDSDHGSRRKKEERSKRWWLEAKSESRWWPSLKIRWLQITRGVKTVGRDLPSLSYVASFL